MFSLACMDIVEALRDHFDREIFTIQGLIGGMLKQTRSSVTILENDVLEQREIVSAHPIALANAFVLLILAEDLAAHHAQEVMKHGAKIEDFTPSYAQVTSKTCRGQIKRFLGIDPSVSRPVQEVPQAPEFFTLNKKYNTYEKRINRETAELSMPLYWYPELFRWSITAQCSCCSSKNVDQAFSTPSNVGRGKDHSSFRVVNSRFRMKSVKTSGLDLRQTNPLRFKLARKLAKHPAWRGVQEADRVKGEAMHDDYMRIHSPQYIGKHNGIWRVESHQKSCRPDRFVKVAEGSEEERYLDKLTRKLCERTGAEYVPLPKRNKRNKRTSPFAPGGVALIARSPPRKTRKCTAHSSAKDAHTVKDSDTVTAGARSSAPVAPAAAREEDVEDGGGKSLEGGESQVQVLEAANASALADRADEPEQIHPENDGLNPFNPAGCGSFAGSAGDSDLCRKSQIADDGISPGAGSSAGAGRAGPAAREGSPAARLHDDDESVECEAMEDAPGVPPSAGGESMADS